MTIFTGSRMFAAVVYLTVLATSFGFNVGGIKSRMNLGSGRYEGNAIRRGKRFNVGMVLDESLKKVIVLGGDGFCGWPTSLYLSDKGHEVIVVDNLSRRKIDIELGCQSLTPIASAEERVNVWNRISNNNMKFKYLDVAKDYTELVQLIKDEQPDTIIHFAEQRAAPYSQRAPRTKRYTIDNNVSGTHNVLCAVVESEIDAHVIHLGTMGVYGYGTSGGEIPEGYLDVILPGDRKSKILHPAYPGSVYHLTKCLDALCFQFYNKNDGVRVTDLHQGIVWGTNTDQTIRDERLINRFDYDGDYGTVLNRFLMQAALNIPLTVYGTGGQTRGFIHISDTARCLEIAMNNPPAAGEKVEIFNQIAETLKVRDLAKLISTQTGVEIRNLVNPRKEDAENELDVSNDKFCNLGLNPITVQEGLMSEVVDITKKYSDRCDRSKILPSAFWTKKEADAAAIDTARMEDKQVRM
jgi:UDP-sulfoquinovose synthase